MGEQVEVREGRGRVVSDGRSTLVELEVPLPPGLPRLTCFGFATRRPGERNVPAIGAGVATLRALDRLVRQLEEWVEGELEKQPPSQLAEGSGYLERVTRERPLSSEDEGMLAGMLGAAESARTSAPGVEDARTPESKANPPSYPKVTGRIGFAHMPGVHQQALDKKPDGWAVLRPRRDGDPSQPTVEDALSPDETGFGLPLAQELGRSKPKAAVEPMPSAPAGYVACRSTGGSNVQTTHLVQLDEHGSNGGRPTMCGLTRFATWVKALQPPAGPGFETVPADTPGSTKREPDLPGWSMRNGGVYGPGVAQVKCEACWENARTSDESAESARVVNPHGVPLVPKKVKP